MPLAVGVEQYPAAPAAVHGHLAWLGVVAFEQVAQCSGLFGVLVDPSVASGAVVRAAHVDDVRGAVPFGVAVCLAAAFPVVVAAAGHSPPRRYRSQTMHRLFSRPSTRRRVAAVGWSLMLDAFR